MKKKGEKYCRTIWLLVLILAVGCAPSQKISNEDFAKLMDEYSKTKNGLFTIGETARNYRKYRKYKEEQEINESKTLKELQNSLEKARTIEFGDSPYIGSKDAPVVIVEFIDFQCAYCMRTTPELHKLAELYPNDLVWVVKNFPLSNHAEAKSAAKAVLAASKQGKYWEMHRALFEKEGKLSSEIYAQLAEKLGLDVSEFQSDFASQEISQQLASDISLARTLDVSATPSLFINGISIGGYKRLSFLRKAVELVLNRKNKEN